MDRFESSYNKFSLGYTNPMINVLCYDCGGMYQTQYGKEDITKQCPKCDGK